MLNVCARTQIKNRLMKCENCTTYTHTHTIYLLLLFFFFILKVNWMWCAPIQCMFTRHDPILVFVHTLSSRYDIPKIEVNTERKKKTPLRMYTHGQIIRKENEIKMKDINGNWRNRNQSIETIKQHERILLPFSCGWLLVFFCSVFCDHVLHIHNVVHQATTSNLHDLSIS